MFLEKIYYQAKSNGYFNKFENFNEFSSYFHDDSSFLKLWKFLRSKQYPVPDMEEFLLNVKDINDQIFISNENYLECIYLQCREDGHFKKFASYETFKEYFKDDNSYKKLWEFLKSKDYQIDKIDTFLNKVRKSSLSPEVENPELFTKNPYSDLLIPEEKNRCFPDILMFGTLGYGDYEIPLMIPLYGEKGLFINVENEEQKSIALSSFQLLAYRIICSLPNGKCKFYLIDPKKNGQSFNQMYGLDSRILHKNVWDDESEISDGLQLIKNEIPVIQAEILTTKYKDLKEYNDQVKYSRKPFQFILISDFPANFTETSVNHLLSIITNGPKCGIYVFMCYDSKTKSSGNAQIDITQFRKLTTEYDFCLNKLNNLEHSEILNEKFFIKSILTKFPNNIDQIRNELNKTLDIVQELKLDAISDKNIWKQSTCKGLTIPIGIAADNKILNLKLGDGKDVHHALIGGATGKGKTVLLHNIIVNASKLYSPDELQFILMDYKEGTEFKIYERLPHIKVLTISGEIDFGLSVFEFLSKEISRRGTLFRKTGCSDFTSYREAGNSELTRLLVIMDEFQVLLDPKKRVSSKISAMLEDITRRGRSFGINMLLCTQSLGEVEISSSTLGQLGIRIGFSMPELDCMKVLHVDNVLPSEFTKVGQAVYNASQGLKDGNVVFQSAYIERKIIEADVSNLLAIAISKKINMSPFIFDGTRDLTIEENALLMQKYASNDFQINENFADAYIGEPFYLSDHHLFLRLRKQQESNLLLIGDDPGGAISCTYQLIEQIIKQSPIQSTVFILDNFPVDSGWKDQFNNLKKPEGIEINIFNSARAIEQILSQIRDEIEKRLNDGSRNSRILLCLMNSNAIRELKKTEYELSAVGRKLQSIIKDGPEFGIHTIIHFLNRKSFEEAFERNAYNEFENKILLKGQNPYDYGKSTDETVNNEFTGFAIHPRSNYEADKFKIYRI